MNLSSEIDTKEYQAELNRHAHLREYLLTTIDNLTVSSPTDVMFQSSILATLTQSTNQLTRESSVNCSSLYFSSLEKKCFV